MNTQLENVLTDIGNTFKDAISKNAYNYLEVSVGRQAQSMGMAELADQFGDVFAVVPLKKPVDGMKVMIDGRTFVDYAQFDNGVAIPGYLARKTSLPHHKYVAPESMVLNFT